MGSNHEAEPSALAENSRSSSESVRCARCKVFNKTCDESCVFIDVFPDTEVENFLLVDDVYGVDQVEGILYGVEPSMRKMAVATLILEAKARKTDPVFGITGMINKLNCQIERLQVDLDVLQHSAGFDRDL